jgi:outer membrane autotransporter protein
MVRAARPRSTAAPALYASFSRDGWYANALASYVRNAYEEQRNVAIGTFNETTQGAPAGNQELANLDGGYDFHRGNWTFGPTAGLLYDHLGVDGFDESGGCSADLSVGREDNTSLRSRLGGHVLYTTRAGPLRLNPFLDASWEHEFLDGQRGITSSFSDIGLGQFTVVTPAAGRESALVTAGLNVDLSDTLSLVISYTAQLDPSDYFGQSVLGGIKISF